MKSVEKDKESRRHLHFRTSSCEEVDALLWQAELHPEEIKKELSFSV
jgi:hypothetical protein